MSAANALPPIFGPEMLADPYPVYRRLREEDPVHWHEEFGAWVLTSYDDVNALLHDPRLTADRAVRMAEVLDPKEFGSFLEFLHNRMTSSDPPRHTRLRGLVSNAFKPHVIEGLRAHIQSLVDGLLDPVVRRGKMDVIADLAFPLPATVITELLGVPPSDRDQLRQWSDEFAAVFAAEPRMIPVEVYRQATAAAQALAQYFDQVIAERRARPRQDLITLLEQAEEQGDRLSAKEMHSNLNLLMVAGHETTTNLIGNGLYALLRNPDQLARLQADPTLVPSAVEEFLRYDCPAQFVYRTALEDLDVRGKTIRKGQTVHLVLAAANRDPAQFPDPDRLDVGRHPNKHVGFGQGIHFCLGAPLARLEGQIAFETILRRLPNPRLGTPAPVYRDNFNLRGLRWLPVEFSTPPACPR